MNLASIITRLKNTFPALSHRNFRLFWTGQCISLVGTWMQNIGQSWLVLQLTHSAFKLGMVTAIQFTPMMLFSLFAGTIADKLPKRRVLLITQSSLMILAVILATLSYFKIIQYWHIILLAGLLGLVQTIDMPTRQSFFIELVGKDDLMNAIAMNSSIFNLARVIGPAVAGLLIGWVGIPVCFYLNALSFIAVIFGIWLIDVRTAPSGSERLGQARDILNDTREGLKYMSTKPYIYLPLLLLAIVSIFVINYNVVVPLVAKENLGQNALGFGMLMTTMGIGSLISALTLAAGSKSGPKPLALGSGAFGISFLLALLGPVRIYWMAALILLLIGYCNVLFTASVNTMIQLNSVDHMRGRVMGVYSLVNGGVTPIGSLIAGKISETAGVGWGLVCCGSVGVLAVIGVAIAYLRITQKECGVKQSEIL